MIWMQKQPIITDENSRVPHPAPFNFRMKKFRLTAKN